MFPEAAIILRTKNEERWIGECLKRLFDQAYANFEIILVDSGSEDKTLEIAEKFPVKIFQIPAEKFSYPYALNLGISQTSAVKYIVILSAHSIPVSNIWLESAISILEKNPKTAGVFGYIEPLPDATFWDRFFQKWILKIQSGRTSRYVVHTSGMGVLGFTNAIIRKDLWEKRHFNEAYGAGGEDGEWAGYWMRRGYVVIRDERFTVMHSHYLGLFGWWRQWRYWKSLNRPRPFRSLLFRQNNTHARS